MVHGFLKPMVNPGGEIFGRLLFSGKFSGCLAGAGRGLIGFPRGRRSEDCRLWITVINKYIHCGKLWTCFSGRLSVSGRSIRPRSSRFRGVSRGFSVVKVQMVRF